jgi:protein ImuB
LISISPLTARHHTLERSSACTPAGHYANMRSVMIVCVLLKRLPLMAALGGAREELLGQPLALAPEPGREQKVGEVSPAAEAFGVVAGMRVGEALARCPELRLVAADPEATRAYWNTLLDRLEALGAGVESDDPGIAWFESRGIERLHGHLEGVLATVRKRLPSAVRLAAAPSRFAAYAAAMHPREAGAGGRRRGAAIVPAGAVRAFLAPLPVGLLRLRAGLEDLPPMLERLGIRTLGELGAMPASAIAERFGHPGLLAHELAQGGDTPLEPRRPAEPLVERLALPEAASGFQLERALEIVIARVLARRERRGRTLRSLALSARFVEGGTWRVSVPLRRPSVDPARLRLVLAPRLADLPAPAESLAVEVEAFGPPAHDQSVLVEDPGDLRRARLGEAVRHVRQATGEESLMRVLEIDPDSRLPERRTVLAPFPEERR